MINIPPKPEQSFECSKLCGEWRSLEKVNGKHLCLKCLKEEYPKVMEAIGKERPGVLILIKIHELNKESKNEEIEEVLSNIVRTNPTPLGKAGFIKEIALATGKGKRILEETYREEIHINNSFEQQEIEIPRTGRTQNRFAKEVAERIENTETMFYSPIRHQIIEIREIYDEEIEKNIWRIEDVSAIRLLNILEEKITFYLVQNQTVKREKTPTENQIKYLLHNDEIVNSLYNLNRFSTVKLPYIKKAGEELVISHKGYNKSLELYVLKDAPKIINMGTEEAKKIIRNIMKDFCFKDEKDLIIAISALITPACRGLYKRNTCRTPIFLYMANRERAGKDYLAGITGIIYEGASVENPPICTEDNHQNNNEEVRKKITSSLLNGRKRLHFSNNRGKLKNVALESASTSEYWSDRLLGGNKEITIPNELEFSLSANIGLTWTPDFWNRCRPINLFFSEEDPNSREFSKPDLHGHIMKNRGKILSAIIKLIKNWYAAGMPKGNTFTSFPEWSRVVGGIMLCNGLGDPCMSLQDDSKVGGDIETINFKKLFGIMNNIQLSSVVREHSKRDIVQVIIQNQDEGEDLFAGWNFDDRSSQTSFGLMFEKFVGRTFDSITLKLAKDNDRVSRRTYSFRVYDDNSENKELATSVTIGNVYTIPRTTNSVDIEEYGNGSQRSPGCQNNKGFKLRDNILETIGSSNAEVNSEVLAYSLNAKLEDVLIVLASLREKGDLFEVRPDYWKKI